MAAEDKPIDKGSVSEFTTDVDNPPCFRKVRQSVVPVLAVEQKLQQAMSTLHSGATLSLLLLCTLMCIPHAERYTLFGHL